VKTDWRSPATCSSTVLCQETENHFRDR